MKVLKVLLLLSVCGVIFLASCKKKPDITHIPDTAVKQDSFQHIIDSIRFVPGRVGIYLGHAEYDAQGAPAVYDAVDTVIVSQVNDTAFIVDFRTSSIPRFKSPAIGKPGPGYIAPNSWANFFHYVATGDEYYELRDARLPTEYSLTFGKVNPDSMIMVGSYFYENASYDTEFYGVKVN